MVEQLRPSGVSTYRDFAIPPVILEQSTAWLALPPQERTAAEAKPSATVMLVRETDSDVVGQVEDRGIEVFVLRRAASMAFAAGMLAFPGGGVDPRDTDPGVPWAGPSPQEWARRLGTDEAQARELVIAAAREVFEECGVLLAGRSTEEVVADLTDPVWDRERDRLLDRTQSFGELLTRLGLVLRTDLLALRGHWTTPTAEPRRYDTRFFAARMPRGQIADARTSEADQVRWARPADLLEEHQRGEVVLLPPTEVMLEQLAAAEVELRSDSGGIERWLAAPVPVHQVEPWPVLVGGTLVMRCPIGPDGHGLPAEPDLGRPWSGGTLTARAHCVLCPNPSPMTHEGTNTWVLGEPGSAEVVVVDPGPADEKHLQAVLAHVAARGARVALTLLTHWHLDHAGSVDRWAELTGAPVRGAGHGPDLVDGEVLEIGGLQLEVLLTPGHTADSVCFLVRDDQLLLTGDTILGRGTTVVAYPDGDLTSYLDTLERLRALTGADQPAALIAPGHGPARTRPDQVVQGYLDHRRERLDEVRQAVRQLRETRPDVTGGAEIDGSDLADQIVQTVYAQVPRKVWPAARRSVLAQLAYLGEL